MKKRSILISGHKTSITLEDPFWDALKTIAAGKGISTIKLIEEIDAERTTKNLSSTLRVYILSHFQNSIPDKRD